MKHLKPVALLLTLALLLAFAGCAKTETPAETPAEAPAEAEPAGITVVDMAGRTVELAAPASRVVALTAADCEILYAIGAGESVIGRGEYCDYPAEVLEIESVESGAETNIEQIIALAPEVVFMSTMAQSEEQVAQLEEAGIRVVMSDAYETEGIAGVYTAIELIGQVMGRSEEAAGVVAGMKDVFEELSASASGDGTKSVYFEVSPLEYGLWTAGNGTYMNELAGMLGLKNIFDDVNTWAEVSEEQVIERNPDFIVTISMYYGEGPTPVEEILSRAGWEGLTAIQENNILNLQNNELSRPGPRLADGARMLYDFVYGVEESSDAA